MRARNVNIMSTRRARRPDAQTYREMRKRSGRLSRKGGMTWIAAILVGALLIGAWMFFH